MTGAAGVTGSTGPIGPLGATGVPGPVGRAGVTGATGRPGPFGQQGATGQQGQPGLTGDPGLRGYAGSTGKITKAACLTRCFQTDIVITMMLVSVSVLTICCMNCYARTNRLILCYCCDHSTANRKVFMWCSNLPHPQGPQDTVLSVGTLCTPMAFVPREGNVLTESLPGAHGACCLPSESLLILRLFSPE